MPVTSGVFLRTLQSAILIDVIISKMDDGMESLSASLSTTTNWGEMVNLLEGRTAIQKNLDRRKEWTELILFNKKSKSCIWDGVTQRNRTGW